MNWRKEVAKAVTKRWDLPLAGVRADWEAVPLNGDALLVRGRRRYPVPVTLYATSYWGELEMGVRQALGFLVAPTGKLVWRRRIIGDMSVSAYEAQGARDQDLSAQAAALAAGAYLGLPGKVLGEGVHVEDVNPDGPNYGKVRAGDLITHVDSTEVGTLQELLDAADGRSNFPVRVVFAQDGTAGRPLDGIVELERDEDGLLGIEVRTHRQHIVPAIDIEVRFDDDTAGPSTGLVLALSMLDVLTPGSITGGRRVAGTGAIGPGGEVLEIGGVDYKVKTAVAGGFDLFLAPYSNLEEALEAAKGRIEVVGVKTLGEAVEALVERGGVLPHLP